MLVCNHVGKTFGRQEVLKDCHFHLKRGEIIGIMGKSGSGKSSLARLIIGLDSPTCGSIHFQGKITHLKMVGRRLSLFFKMRLVRSIHILVLRKF